MEEGTDPKSSIIPHESVSLAPADSLQNARDSKRGFITAWHASAANRYAPVRAPSLLPSWFPGIRFLAAQTPRRPQTPADGAEERRQEMKNPFAGRRSERAPSATVARGSSAERYLLPPPVDPRDNSNTGQGVRDAMSGRAEVVTCEYSDL
ncbi:hypothetical protein SKAU_G00253500 [Synaphobranchus kaupii]|uniref:Uncharacterized protein n=1 Tax=Synaphobranchus kaupii TaxID=118154 RepID=A0A9Q1F3B7_SYNKA|nr:hypothetical protein SKAU_G00253500 [Synaphobranchus kaupii]